jgi:hypothetical protein
MSADALLDWLEVRRSIDWIGTGETPEPVVGCRDGFWHHIEAFMRPHDPARADRMSVALERAREEARTGAELDLERLARWQTIVLGKEAAFRRLPAFAKGGRERYDGGEGVESVFRESLLEINERRVPLTARAARAYLDIISFHPFEDGNARAAGLALDFALARAGIVLDQVGPIVMLTRYAGDRDAALSLVKLVSILACATRRHFEHHRR